MQVLGRQPVYRPDVLHLPQPTVGVLAQRRVVAVVPPVERHQRARDQRVQILVHACLTGHQRLGCLPLERDGEDAELAEQAAAGVARA